MGIPSYFSYIVKNHRNIINKIKKTDKIDNLYYYMQFIKFGFGFCMDHACHDLRENIISRKDAYNLVKKYDGKCSEEYIRKFCDYIDISMEKFWETVESFRGEMWEKDIDGKGKNLIWQKLDSVFNE